MELLIGFALGCLVMAYWRDKKFRDFINAKLFKKTQPEKKQVDDKNKPKDESQPII